MPSPALLTARGLTWRSPAGELILSDLDLDLSAERVGLVGGNGAGKSTLLRILAGQLSPSSGQLSRAGTVALQDQRPPEAASLAELLGIAEPLETIAAIEAGALDQQLFDAVEGHWDIAERALRALSDLGLALREGDLRRPLDAFSGGELRRALLARPLLTGPDILLLDEPSNDLDASGREALRGMIEGWRGALLVASHDRALLAGVDRILELGPAGLRSFAGGYEAYAAAREQEATAAARRVELEARALERRKRELQAQRERIERSAARGRKARRRGDQPKMVLDARKARNEATASRHAELSERRLEAQRRELAEARAAIELSGEVRLPLPDPALAAGRPVASLRGAGLRRGGWTLGPLDLSLVGPHRLALVGDNGAGKTSLARLLTGDLAPSFGEARPARRVGWLDQRAALLDDALSPLEQLRAANPELQPQAARWLLARLLLTDAALRTPAGSLSGGERVRLALATLLAAAAPPQLLILDEPGNDLDIPSQARLCEALRGYKGALIVISHDPALLDEAGLDEELSLTREDGLTQLRRGPR